MADILLPAGANLIDAATLSGGSWDIENPLSNLQLRDLSRPAISTDDSNASTDILIDFGSAVTLGIFAVIRTNSPRASNPDTIRLRLNSTSFAVDANPASPLYDSTALAMSALLPRNTYSVHWFCCPGRVSARYGRLQIDCTTIPAGQLAIARLFASDSVALTYNYSLGAGWGFDDGSDVIQGKGGVEQYDPVSLVQTFSCALQFQDKAATFGERGLKRMLSDRGITGEMVAILDPDESTYRYDQPIYGRLRALNNIENPIPLRHSLAVEIKGTL